jgi:hypothetical protein
MSDARLVAAAWGDDCGGAAHCRAPATTSRSKPCTRTGWKRDEPSLLSLLQHLPRSRNRRNNAAPGRDKVCGIRAGFPNRPEVRMGSTAAHSEVVRAEVTELFGGRVDAVDRENKPIGQGRDSIPMMAVADSPTIDAWSAQVSAAGAKALPAAGELRGSIGACRDCVTSERWVGGRGIARGYRGSLNPTANRFVDCRRRRGRRHRALPPGGDGSRRGQQR